MFYPLFYPFPQIFRPFSASGRHESREHGRKSRGKRGKSRKIGKWGAIINKAFGRIGSRQRTGFAALEPAVTLAQLAQRPGRSVLLREAGASSPLAGCRPPAKLHRPRRRPEPNSATQTMATSTLQLCSRSSSRQQRPPTHSQQPQPPTTELRPAFCHISNNNNNRDALRRRHARFGGAPLLAAPMLLRLLHRHTAVMYLCVGQVVTLRGKSLHVCEC